MIRHAAAVGLALCMSQSWLCAQDAVFTVTTSSAEVHKAPTVASPVIGSARQGARLDVTRELGSWVSVTWPGVTGEAFVHVSRGSLAPGSATGIRRAVATSAPERSVVAPSAAASEVHSVEQRVLAQVRSPLPPVYSTPTHILGLGAQIGGAAATSFGASGRAWRVRLGLQLNVSRYAVDSAFAAERLTSVQFEPSALYAPRDLVTDYVWVRPYVGTGLSLYRHTVRSQSAPGALASSSGLGTQVFGGGELTFAGLPQFAASLDFGRRWARTSLAGFDLGGYALSVSGHWYLR